jgi:hypothetical protein
MSLPRALLLAAASVLSLSVKATEYQATWILDTGNTATVIIGVDDTHPDWLANWLRSYYRQGYGQTWLTRFDLSIVSPGNNLLQANTINDLYFFDWIIQWGVDGSGGVLYPGTNKVFGYFEAYLGNAYIWDGGFDSFMGYGRSFMPFIPSFSIYSGSTPPPPAPTTITTTIAASDALVTGGAPCGSRVGLSLRSARGCSP